MDGPAPAIVNAVADALKISFDSIPLLPEDIFDVLAAGPRHEKASESQPAGGVQ
jgi:hypothetical protein